MARTRKDDQLTRLVAERVRSWRVKQEMTQEDLAHRANIRSATVSNVENARSHPSLALVAAIAKGLGCHVGDLVDEEAPTLSREEMDIVAQWRRLAPDLRAAVYQVFLALPNGE